MMHEGHTQPMVAMMAPGSPATWMPTKVAELIAIGPGVIWEMVMMSTNCCMVIQPCRSTT